jgi:hypothetical protein
MTWTYGVTPFFTDTIKETLFDRVVLLLRQFSTMHDKCGESLFVSPILSKIGDDLHRGTLRHRVALIDYIISYYSPSTLYVAYPAFLRRASIVVSMFHGDK